MAIIRKFKCVILDGDNVVLDYVKERNEWDLPGELLQDPERILSEVKKHTEQRLDANVDVTTFLGTHDYDHDGDLHRTYLFRGEVQKVNSQRDHVRSIPLGNLDKPTLNDSFAQSLPLLKKKLLLSE